MYTGTISGWPSGWATASHGIVYAAERNAEPGNVAIKVHRSRDAFERERDAYLRYYCSFATRSRPSHSVNEPHASALILFVAAGLLPVSKGGFQPPAGVWTF